MAPLIDLGALTETHANAEQKPNELPEGSPQGRRRSSIHCGFPTMVSAAQRTGSDADDSAIPAVDDGLPFQQRAVGDQKRVRAAFCG